MSPNCLKEILVKKRMKPVDLARKTGISAQSIWNFENNRGGLSRENMEKVLTTLNVSYEYLMSLFQYRLQPFLLLQFFLSIYLVH